MTADLAHELRRLKVCGVATGLAHELKVCGVAAGLAATDWAATE